jgi:hypothetical protein
MISRKIFFPRNLIIREFSTQAHYSGKLCGNGFSAKKCTKNRP